MGHARLSWRFHFGCIRYCCVTQVFAGSWGHVVVLGSSDTMSWTHKEPCWRTGMMRGVCCIAFQCTCLLPLLMDEVPLPWKMCICLIYQFKQSLWLLVPSRTTPAQGPKQARSSLEPVTSFFQRRKHNALPLNYIAAWVHRVRKRSCPLLTPQHIAGLSAYLGIILLHGNPHLAQTCINLPSIRGCDQRNKTTSSETSYSSSPLLHWYLVLSYGLVRYMLEQPWGDSDLHQRLSQSLLVWWSEKYKRSIKPPLTLPCT